VVKISVKTEAEIAKMREAGRCAAFVLDAVKKQVAPGVSTWDLDQFAKKTMDSVGAVSASYGYGGKKNPFPGYICISLNEEVVHGIGRKDRIIREGDLVSLDVALFYNGFAGDNTATVAVGRVDEEWETLSKVTEQALYRGIDQAMEGNCIGDISWAIQSFAEAHHLGVVRELVGHGIGKEMHEEPQIPNVGRPHSGVHLKAGMTLAIEPMLTSGAPRLRTLEDGWTIVTADGKPSAHFEHTVLITKEAPEILTRVKN
jgi:methionyl aminopeptidase